jgi:hypothetical protein
MLFSNTNMDTSDDVPSQGLAESSEAMTGLNGKLGICDLLESISR